MDAPVLTPSEAVLGRQTGGFDFELVHRNERLVASLGASGKLPKTRKTGTTICGVIYSGGIVLGADTRATEDSTVCDKDCAKIHYIAPNIYCCGAGTSADTENVTLLVSSNLELLRRQTGTPSRVVTSMTMLKRYLFERQGQVSAALVLGGVDLTGPHLYCVYPHGSTDKLPFVTMGSGSLAAMAVLESGFKDGLSEAEATALVAAAIRAGIFNDLGSGSNVDITVIRSAAATAALAPAGGAALVGGGSSSSSSSSSSSASSASSASAKAAAGGTSVSILRSFQRPNEVADVRATSGVPRPQARNIPRGATKVLSTTFTPHANTVASK